MKTAELRRAGDAPTVAPRQPLNFMTKLGYGLGNFGVMVGKQAPKQLSMPIYNVALGVNPAAVGTVLAAGRFWDALTDPLVGHWSDRVATRWGRRRPFIFLGAILSGLFFAAMWLFPRDLSSSQYLAYFVATSFLFYLALTIFSVPWYALGYELAGTYDERTRLMAFPTAIGPIGQILVGWLYFFTQLDIFTDTIEGIRFVGLGAGVVLMAFGVMPAFLVKERPIPAPARARQRPSLLAGVKAAAKNGAFVRLTVAFTLIVIGTSMVGGLGFYVHVYYLFGGDTKAASVLVGWHTTIMLVCSILVTPLITKLSVRFGKKEIFMAGLVWGSARMVMLWFLLDPAHPWLVLLNGALWGIDNAAIFMLCHAMIADVCDIDELHHGSRREGLYGAIYGWVFKTGIALSFGVSGYILVGIGFDRGLGGDQAASTLSLMKTFYCVIPVLAFVAALTVFRRYPIDRKLAHEVRTELDARQVGPGGSC